MSFIMGTMHNFITKHKLNHYGQPKNKYWSIRQGCPISALLFLLVAEIVAISIRNDAEIKGIHFSNIEFKLGMMADDTSLFLKNLVSIKKSINKFLDSLQYAQD